MLAWGSLARGWGAAEVRGRSVRGNRYHLRPRRAAGRRLSGEEPLDLQCSVRRRRRYPQALSGVASVRWGLRETALRSNSASRLAMSLPRSVRARREATAARPPGGRRPPEDRSSRSPSPDPAERALFAPDATGTPSGRRPRPRPQTLFFHLPDRYASRCGNTADPAIRDTSSGPPTLRAQPLRAPTRHRPFGSACRHPARPAPPPRAISARPRRFACSSFSSTSLHSPDDE